MTKEFAKMLNTKKGQKFKVKYADLKNHLNYEDFFYELVLMPTLKEVGMKHSFDKEYIIIEPIEEVK